MSVDDNVCLEKGLCYFFENQREFEKKQLPVEKQVALGFEAGFEAGRTMLRQTVAKTFKLSNIDFGYERS